MVQESMEHKRLKQYVIRLNPHYIAIEEGRIGRKRIDVIFINQEGNIRKLVECVVTQSLTKARDKLENIRLNSLSIEREIIRIFKEKNPKARKVIKSIEDKGIIFTEVKD